MGEVIGPHSLVDPAPEAFHDFALAIFINPRPVTLDNLLRDIDLRIDEMWREGWEPPLSSCSTSLGSNDVEIFLYCICDVDLEEVKFEVDCDGDILILYCGVYRLLSETCGYKLSEE